MLYSVFFFFLKGFVIIDEDRVFFFFEFYFRNKKKRKDYGFECIMNEGSFFVGFVSDKRLVLLNG